MSQRHRVINLYKELYHIGREYPKGALWFHERLKSAFIKNKNEMDPEKVEELIKRGEYVVKEIEALYMLRKYRTMKERYYADK
uniref:Complex1_LYR_dom domain-containing protein n=1 Tax=Heterorhabditis bacteriophora TaxID=37862 RepID=A0A1I7XLE0_HETBA